MAEADAFFSMATLGSFMYQATLVLFIALHLLVGTAFTFAAGLYTGLYISQNYDVPRVDEPTRLVDNLRAWAETRRRK